MDERIDSPVGARHFLIDDPSTAAVVAGTIADRDVGVRRGGVRDDVGRHPARRQPVLAACGAHLHPLTGDEGDARHLPGDVRVRRHHVGRQPGEPGARPTSTRRSGVDQRAGRPDDRHGARVRRLPPRRRAADARPVPAGQRRRRDPCGASSPASRRESAYVDVDPPTPDDRTAGASLRRRPPASSRRSTRPASSSCAAAGLLARAVRRASASTWPTARSIGRVHGGELDEQRGRRSPPRAGRAHVPAGPRVRRSASWSTSPSERCPRRSTTRRPRSRPSIASTISSPSPASAPARAGCGSTPTTCPGCSAGRRLRSAAHPGAHRDHPLRGRRTAGRAPSRAHCSTRSRLTCPSSSAA